MHWGTWFTGDLAVLSSAFWDPLDFWSPCSNIPQASGHNALLWALISCLHKPNNSSLEGAEGQDSEFWIYLPTVGALPTDYTWVNSETQEMKAEDTYSAISLKKKIESKSRLNPVSLWYTNKNHIHPIIFKQFIVQIHTCLVYFWSNLFLHLCKTLTPLLP